VVDGTGLSPRRPQPQWPAEPAAGAAAGWQRGRGDRPGAGEAGRGGVCDHDSQVVARRRVSCRVWELGGLLDWALERARAAGFASVTVACKPTGHRWRVLDQLAAERGLPLVCVQPLLVWRAREAEDLTWDKSDPKDAVVIAPAGRAAALLRPGADRIRRGRGCGTWEPAGRGWSPTPPAPPRSSPSPRRRTSSTSTSTASCG
jgi:hypothetical protein